MEEAQPTRRSVEEGLVGTLFLPARRPLGPRPAVVVLGGSGGGLREEGARAFAGEGFAALALAYFGVKPLPEELVEIPLEYFGRAFSWLEEQPEVDAGRIAVVGGSKGGELALLLGATYPEDVKAVVGYVPSGLAWQGISFSPRGLLAGPKSSWTLRGKPVPFLPFAAPRFSEIPSLVGFVLGKPAVLAPIYERALDDEDAVKRAAIPVERIRGPVLLVSGADDRLWPSSRLSEMVIERLEAHGHPYPHEHLRYEEAGHLITIPEAMPPPEEPGLKRFELGGSREINEAASADAWPKVLAVLRRGFGSP